MIDRDDDGQRLYVLLALFDKRDGTFLSDLVQTAREGWERSHPDMGPEDGAWDDFDRLWAVREECLAPSRWGCECGAVWDSPTGDPPKDRMCSPTCPKPLLFRLPETTAFREERG